MNDPELRKEALRWIRFAQEDLQEAERLLGLQEAVPRHICWFAQQAAEKALKAGLVLEGIDFPFRHDLDTLRNLLPPGWSVKPEHPDLAELTAWAVEARYPGDWPEAAWRGGPPRGGAGKSGLRLHRQGLREAWGEARGRVSHGDDRPRAGRPELGRPAHPRLGHGGVGGMERGVPPHLSRTVHGTRWDVRPLAALYRALNFMRTGIGTRKPLPPSAIARDDSDRIPDPREG